MQPEVIVRVTNIRRNAKSQRQRQVVEDGTDVIACSASQFNHIVYGQMRNFTLKYWPIRRGSANFVINLWFENRVK